MVASDTGELKFKSFKCVNISARRGELEAVFKSLNDHRLSMVKAEGRKYHGGHLP